MSHRAAITPKKPQKQLLVADQLLAPAHPAGACSSRDTEGPQLTLPLYSFSVTSPKLAALCRTAHHHLVRVAPLITCPGDPAAPQGGFAGSSHCTALIWVHLSSPAAGFISPSSRGDLHGQQISFKI